MKSIITTIIVLHAFIHILGFLKAFSLADIRQLTIPIGKVQGILWLLSFMILCIGSIFYGMSYHTWSLWLMVGVILSQILVFYSWNDAKFATMLNGFILIIAIIGYAEMRFTLMVKKEIRELTANTSVNIKGDIVKEADMHTMPQCVQLWLKNSGIIGKEKSNTVYIRQKVKMKTSAEQEQWYDAEAEQYYTISKPAFIWSVDMTMMYIVPVAGRDKFLNGKGEMLIKLGSLIPIVKSADNAHINEGTMQRYLGEIVWFPSAALQPYITWQEIDAYSARAVMNYMSTECSGVFSFDEAGNLKSFSTQRYMGDEKIKREWRITVDEIQSFNGIKIPSELHATWKLESGDWTWLNMEIEDVQYNTSFE